MEERIPPGTRDILPEEMEEIRTIENALLECFASFGYSEVRTPAIEYAVVTDKVGDGIGESLRFLDDRGELVSLRSDMTVPIARLAAGRLEAADIPWRLCYLGNCFRSGSPKRGELREFGQAGIELMGLPGNEGIAEVLRVLDRSLEAVGLTGAVVGIGDAGVWPAILEDLGVDGPVVDETRLLLAAGDQVGLEVALAQSGSLGPDGVSDALKLLRVRGSLDRLQEAASLGGDRLREALSRIEAAAEAAEAAGVGRELAIDLGMARPPGYYTGQILEVYDPSVGRSLGGGGRYDRLLADFGVDRSAAGFTLYTERIHEAQLGGKG